ncbi:AGE family epimerase/isomerase [Catenovulum adriaticum]|uniref:AGE family epimerase/isomerase n=1 Tax=Catenovulum adriaticum TaxID=2984846 RepID=A0ABY7AR16_9ALTE|nr:AGE family epimerase/isomerase [Catenovulum sp. TS8]WAJ71717.1 AGE family epimerase/isomerase [Catenovulum sp. TS8]
MPDNNLVKIELSRYINWVKNKAIPFSLAQGFNSETGAFYEHILANGMANKKANMRVRVQARQQFVVCYATDRGWLNDAQIYSDKLNQFLLESGKSPKNEALFAHLVSPEKMLLDDKIDLYDSAFHLLGFAWRYKVFNDNTALDNAQRLVSQLDILFKGHAGGWNEGDYATHWRRQNPHMHLFEAFLALYEATNQAKWLARAAEIYSLFEQVFFDHKDTVLLEFFERDWRPFNGQGGKVVEPGHMLEWVWLLKKYQSFTGSPVDNYCLSLFQNAIELGLNASTGLFHDQITPNGKAISHTHRCWSLTEYLKASIALANDSQIDTDSHIIKSIEAIFKYYVTNETNGLYVDCIGKSGDVIDDKVQTSTLYHLVLAAGEAEKYLTTLD